MTDFNEWMAVEADKTRRSLIAEYLIRHENDQPRTEFFTVVDDALYAEEEARLSGTYPPDGHPYPREGHR